MSDGLGRNSKLDESRYERPNKPWLCGHAGEGCPCRVGPSPDGKCRAVAECQPSLVVKEGETKGTWVCTRPKDWGGSCVHGPLPDGSCCNAIARCTPVRSLRTRRGLVVRAVIAACVGILLFGLAATNRETFLNPGPVSQHHTGHEFGRLAATAAGAPAQGCVLCHPGANGDFIALASDAVRVGKASLSLTQIAGAHPKDFSRMDASCVKCHEGHSFHQPNVARDTSCAICHREHQGAGPMPAVAAADCATCHGDDRQLRDAAARARTLPVSFFAKPVAPGLRVPATARPTDGLIRRITGFDVDHPEFQVVREKQTDPNALLFSHRLHLAGDRMPPTGGQPLTCASCHQPDTSGAFMQRVTFEQNCRTCHALNFDQRNPDMALPHGDPALARAYLRSLPTQYAAHASRSLGMVAEREISAFVTAQMQELRSQVHTGEDLERDVFFSGAETSPRTRLAGLPGTARARMAGCAYCHTVSPRENGTPHIEAPVMPDRWLLHANFNHARHVRMDCTECHAAAKSDLASDIILPTRQSCVKCHSPTGGVSADCTVCHTYHNSPPAGWPASAIAPPPP